MDNKLRALTYVKWQDSVGCGQSWAETDGIEAPEHYCHSVGWVVAESDRSIVIVPHVSLESEFFGLKNQGCGDMTIPKPAIVQRTVMDLDSLVNGIKGSPHLPPAPEGS
jgi:hypothetical protein